MIPAIEIPGFQIGILSIILLGVLIWYLPTGHKPKPFREVYKGQNKNVAHILEEIEKETLKQLKYNNTLWTYFDSENENHTLFFLHGMGADYRIWWQQIHAFRDRYRIIAINLPGNISTTEEASQGIIHILDKENIPKAHFIGTSMGGYIIQRLMLLAPERLLSAVLSNTFPPNKLKWAINKNTYFTTKLTPGWVMWKMIWKNYNNQMFPASNHTEKLRAYILSTPFNKKHFLNRFHVVTDYFELKLNQDIRSIPKLIIESDNDPQIEKELQNLLKSHFYEARIYTFHNGGHFPYVCRADEYNLTLKTFLSDTYH